MITVAVGMYASAWPEKIHAHPGWIVAIFAVGVLLMMLGFLAPSQQKGEHGQPSVNAPIHVEVRPTFNNAPAINQTASPTQTNTITVHTVTPEAPSRSPRVSIRTADRRFLEKNHTAWHIAPVGLQGAVVWVENEPAPVGELGAAADVAAQIRFFRDGQEIAFVNRAYWIDHSANKIPLEIGEKQALILGCYKDWCWLYSSNPNSQPFKPKSGVTNVTGIREYRISIQDALDAEVTLIDVVSGKTLASARYQLRASDDLSFFLGDVK